MSQVRPIRTELWCGLDVLLPTLSLSILYLRLWMKYIYIYMKLKRGVKVIIATQT